MRFSFIALVRARLSRALSPLVTAAFYKLKCQRVSLLAMALLAIASSASLPAGAAGYYAQSGKIYDATGQEIQIRGINHFGFNATILQPMYLWQMGWKEQIAQIKSLGFNAVRVPFVPDTLYNTGTVDSLNYIDAGKNPEFIGKTPLQALDLWMAEADRQGLYIMLDFHSVSMQRQYPTWFVDNPADFGIIYNKQAYTVANWTRDLAFVARRYAGLAHFMAIDIYNEPASARWDAGDPNVTDSKYYWKPAAESAAATVLAANPNLLIFVQGTMGNWDGIENGNLGMNWGENFQPQRYKPLNIPANKLVLSPHTYGPDVYAKSSFSASNFPSNLAGDWETLFGQFSPAHPVIISEWGGHYGNGLGGAQDIAWQNALVDYLLSKNIRNSFYWCYTPNSGDTGGILDDSLNVRTDKMALLQKLWGSSTTPVPPPPPVAPAVASLAVNAYNIAQSSGSVTVTVNRTGSFTNAMSVALKSTDGVAIAGIDYTAVNATLNWSSGDSAPKTFAVAISNAVAFQGNKAFTLTLSNASPGAVLGAITSATVTIAGSAVPVASPPKLSFSAATLSVPQTSGFATVNVVRAGNTSNAVSVEYRTTNGSALAGTNYTAQTGTLRWTVGEGGTKSFLVPITNAAAFSGSKNFSVSLSRPTGGAVTSAPVVATVNIQGTGSAIPQPYIDSFSPQSGTVGTVVTLVGNGFTGLNQAWVGDARDGTVLVLDDNHVQVTIPADATTGAIGLFNSARAAFTPLYFTVLSMATPTYPQQYISSFSPTSGPVGTVVTLIGSGFTNSNQAWAGNARNAGLRVVDDNHAQITIPADATTGAVAIMNPVHAAFTPIYFSVTP